jgi:hypothetical protein
MLPLVTMAPPYAFGSGPLWQAEALILRHHSHEYERYLAIEDRDSACDNP